MLNQGLAAEFNEGFVAPHAPALPASDDGEGEAWAWRSGRRHASVFGSENGFRAVRFVVGMDSVTVSDKDIVVDFIISMCDDQPYTFNFTPRNLGSFCLQFVRNFAGSFT